MLASALPLPSSPSPMPSPITDVSRASPPSTPPGDKYSTRQSSATSSDDSSLFELSFEYQFDADGNWVRLPNGKSKSNHSSPPTPPETHYKHERRSSPKSSIDGNSPASLLEPLARRNSLSRSESAYVAASGPSQPSSAVNGSSALRPFQRVASGPAVMNAVTPVAPSALRSALGQLSTGISSTARKIGRPQRVTIEQYREMEERNRRADEELRAREESDKRKWEEKENLLNAQTAIGSSSTAISSRRLSPPAPLSRHASEPYYGSSSAAPASKPDRMLAMRPGGFAGSSALPDAVPAAQRNVRKTPLARTTARPWKGAKYVSEMAGGFENIAEDEDPDVQSANEYGEGDTDPGGDDPPVLYNGLRGRSYADLGETNAMVSSAGGRPRRSASLSDTMASDGRYASAPNLFQQSMVPPARPESSLGHSTNGARRVTLEEHLKQTKLAREQEAEYRRMQRLQAESATIAEAEDSAEAERQDAMIAEGYAQSRQSPSPTNKNSHIHHAYSHKRRDSDTLRSIQQPSATSPTVVDAVPPRLSPSASNLPVVGLKHRRSPTAPDPSTTSGMLAGSAGKIAGKTWAGEVNGRDSGGDDELDPIPGGYNGYMHHQPQQSRHAASGHGPSRGAEKATADVRPRNMLVNKKAFARLDLIGKGGSSRVYRVMNGSNEIYAIKRVNLDHIDSETMSGYMNEIDLLKRLEGNNRIIRLIDSELKPGPYGSRGHLMLVMECGEIDLARLLQEQQTKPTNMVWIAYYWQQMLEAVHVIHEEKIVHSDLKPANFVLVRGQLKLIDFGIANAIANDTTNIQRDHQIGTANYMSPEAIEIPDGKRRLKVGRPSDVWSLGCILYQMVYGQPPFQQLSVYQKMKAIPDAGHVIDFPNHSSPLIPSSRIAQREETPPKKLDHLKRRVPKSVISTMRNCLTRNPKERATIPELLEHSWLVPKEPEPPRLGPSEAIINPYYMSQLLQYGMKLGHHSPDMDKESLLKEAERLVTELQGLD